MTASVGTVLLDIASYAVGSSRFRRSLASHSSKRQCCQSSPSSSRGLHRCAHRMSPHGPPRLARMPSGLRGCRASAPAQRRCSSGRAGCSSQCAAQCRARLPDCTRHTGSLRSSLTLRVANSCSCHAPRASFFSFLTRVSQRRPGSRAALRLPAQARLCWDRKCSFRRSGLTTRVRAGSVKKND